MAARRPRHEESDPRREVVDAIRSGRLTRTQAARELGISKEAVSRWVRAARDPHASFVAVSVRDDAPPPVAVVEIVLAGGRVLRVPVGIDAPALVRVVRALESC